MKKPETFWILPHRDQSGDEDVVKDGQLIKLTAALSVEQLPKELVLGIPESVLRGHREQELIFAQYVRDRSKGRAFFAISVTSGKDKDGRTVYLTFVEILGLGERPQLQPTVEGLPQGERRKAEKLLSRLGNLNNLKDKWVRRVSDMLKAGTAHRWIESFSNVSIPDAAFPPQWTPEKKAQRALAIAVSVCALAAFGLLLALKSCQH